MATRARRRVALADVNVLVALAWPNHAHHAAAHAWFDAHHAAGWATTAVTESGFVRISSNRAALPTSSTPEAARQVLRSMTELRGHRFWTDDVRLVLGEESAIRAPNTYRQVTDAHLLALAAHYDGRLVTFDAGIGALLGELPSETLAVLPSPV